jgi:hypothetical protein
MDRDAIQELSEIAGMADGKADELSRSARIWANGQTGHETQRMEAARHELASALYKAAEAWQHYGAEVSLELRRAG